MSLPLLCNTTFRRKRWWENIFFRNIIRYHEIMSNLRHKTRVPLIVIEEEVEAPIIAPQKYDAPRPPPPLRRVARVGDDRQLAPSQKIPPSSSGKCCANSHTSSNTRTWVASPTRGGGVVVPMLREIIVGFTLGILAVSIFIFLDHEDVIQMQSTHNYRNKTYRLMMHETTMREKFEENLGLMFMKADVYPQRT